MPASMDARRCQRMVSTHMSPCVRAYGPVRHTVFEWGRPGCRHHSAAWRQLRVRRGAGLTVTSCTLKRVAQSKAEGAGPREGLRHVSKKAAQSKAGLWRTEMGCGVSGVTGQMEVEE